MKTRKKTFFFFFKFPNHECKLWLLESASNQTIRGQKYKGRKENQIHRVEMWNVMQLTRSMKSYRGLINLFPCVRHKSWGHVTRLHGEGKRREGREGERRGRSDKNQISPLFIADCNGIVIELLVRLTKQTWRWKSESSCVVGEV